MNRLTSTVRSLVVAAAYIALTLLLIPVQAAAVAAGLSLRTSLPVLYHGWVLRLLGFKVTVYGTRSTVRPTLFVSNHASYLDIEALGSLIPGSFVAKSEVAGWPGFGLLAKLQRTVFVDRRVRQAQQQKNTLVERLSAGDNLILFPEGTSTDGNRVTSFKSSLLAIAEQRIGDRPLIVQPVTIAYVRLNGIPIGRTLRPYYAWYGDMALAGHLWRVMGLGKAELVVQFHQPVTAEAIGSRKRLAAYCERVIGEALAAANAGRLPPPEPAPVRQLAAPAQAVPA